MVLFMWRELFESFFSSNFKLIIRRVKGGYFLRRRKKEKISIKFFVVGILNLLLLLLFSAIQFQVF